MADKALFYHIAHLKTETYYVYIISLQKRLRLVNGSSGCSPANSQLMKSTRKKKTNSIEMLQIILCTDIAKIEGCTLRFETLLTGLLLKLNTLIFLSHFCACRNHKLLVIASNSDIFCQKQNRSHRSMKRCSNQLCVCADG